MSNPIRNTTLRALSPLVSSLPAARGEASTHTNATASTYDAQPAFATTGSDSVQELTVQLATLTLEQTPSPVTQGGVQSMPPVGSPSGCSRAGTPSDSLMDQAQEIFQDLLRSIASMWPIQSDESKSCTGTPASAGRPSRGRADSQQQQQQHADILTTPVSDWLRVPATPLGSGSTHRRKLSKQIDTSVPADAYTFAPTFRRDSARVYVPTFRTAVSSQLTTATLHTGLRGVGTRSITTTSTTTTIASSSASQVEAAFTTVSSPVVSTIVPEGCEDPHVSSRASTNDTHLDPDALPELISLSRPSGVNPPLGTAPVNGWIPKTPFLFTPSELSTYITSEWAAHMERVYRHRLEEMAALARREKASAAAKVDPEERDTELDNLDASLSHSLTLQALQERLRQAGLPCPDPPSPELDLLAAAGLRHEKRLLDWLITLISQPNNEKGHLTSPPESPESEHVSSSTTAGTAGTGSINGSSLSSEGDLRVLDLERLFSSAVRGHRKPSSRPVISSDSASGGKASNGLEGGALVPPSGLTFSEILRLFVLSGQTRANISEMEFAEMIAKSRRNAAYHNRSSKGMTRLKGLPFGERVALSYEAIKCGVDVLYQPVLHGLVREFDADAAQGPEGQDKLCEDDPMNVYIRGFPDFVVRINLDRSDAVVNKAQYLDGVSMANTLRADWSNRNSRLGYEVWDAKLARTPKPAAIIQIVQYAMLIEQYTGVPVPNGVVALGNGLFYRFPIADFVPYVRMLQQRFCNFLRNFDPDFIPPPPASEQLQGNFTEFAAKVLANSDHISRIARLHWSKIKPLEALGIRRTRQVAILTAFYCPKTTVYISRSTLDMVLKACPTLAEDIMTRINYWQNSRAFEPPSAFGRQNGEVSPEELFDEQTWLTNTTELIPDSYLSPEEIADRYFPIPTHASRQAKRHLRETLEHIARKASADASAPPIDIPGFVRMPICEALHLFLKVEGMVSGRGYSSDDRPKSIWFNMLDMKFGKPMQPPRADGGTSLLDISIGSIDSSALEEALGGNTGSSNSNSTGMAMDAVPEVDECAQQLGDLKITVASEQLPEVTSSASPPLHQDPIDDPEMAKANEVADHFAYLLRLLTTRPMIQAALQFIDTTTTSCGEIVSAMIHLPDQDGVTSLSQTDDEPDPVPTLPATTADLEKCDDLLDESIVLATAPESKVEANSDLSEVVITPPFALLPPVISSVTVAGLPRLPPASPGDIYFDLEGYQSFDPRSDNVPSATNEGPDVQPPTGDNVQPTSPTTSGKVQQGLEYLFGLSTWTDEFDRECKPPARPFFMDWWAHNLHEERRVFESFMDFLSNRLSRYPDMHVYHYAAYEVSALKRLAQKYGTREAELDALLSKGIFVDMYPLITNSLALGQPKYSLKNVERLLYSVPRWILTGASAHMSGSTGEDTSPLLCPRTGEVTNAMGSVVIYDNWLRQGGTFGPATAPTSDDSNLEHEQDVARGSSSSTNWRCYKELSEIRAYNRDDCDNLLYLTEWVRSLQHRLPFTFQPTMHTAPPTVVSVTGTPAAKQVPPAEVPTPSIDAVRTLDFTSVITPVKPQPKQVGISSVRSPSPATATERQAPPAQPSPPSPLPTVSQLSSAGSTDSQHDATSRQPPATNLLFIDDDFFDSVPSEQTPSPSPKTNPSTQADVLTQSPERPKKSRFIPFRHIPRLSPTIRVERALKFICGFLEPGRLDLGLCEEALGIENELIADIDITQDSESPSPGESQDASQLLKQSDRNERLHRGLSLVHEAGTVEQQNLDLQAGAGRRLVGGKRCTYFDVARLSPWRKIPVSRVCALLKALLPVWYAREPLITDKPETSEDELDRLAEEKKREQEALAELNAKLRQLEKLRMSPGATVLVSAILPILASQIGDLVSHYKRENKPLWWNLYALEYLTEDELLSEQSVLAGMTLVSQPPKAEAIGTGTITLKYRFPISQSLPQQLGSPLRTPLPCRLVGFPRATCSVKNVTYITDRISDQSQVSEDMTLSDALRIGCTHAYAEVSFPVSSQLKLMELAESRAQLQASEVSTSQSIFPSQLCLAPFEIVDTSTLEAAIVAVATRYLSSVLSDLESLVAEAQSQTGQNRACWVTEQAISPLLFSYLLRLPPWLSNIPVFSRTRSGSMKLPAPNHEDLVDLMEALVPLDSMVTSQTDSPLSPAPVLIVQGPPGTGKTSLTTRAVHTLLARHPNARIGVLSNGHIAIDHFLETMVSLELDAIRSSGSDSKSSEPRAQTPASLLILKGGSIASADLDRYSMSKAEFNSITGTPSKRKVKSSSSIPLECKFVRELAPKELWATYSGLQAMNQSDGNGLVPKRRVPNVVAGTAWLFAQGQHVTSVEGENPDEYQHGLDWLVVEEAGQLALAHLVAALAARGYAAPRGLLLLGDDRQLQVPLRGSAHPGDSSSSALGYAMRPPIVSSLGPHGTSSVASSMGSLASAESTPAVVPPNKGLFLPISFRMPPTICASISKAFYDAQLMPKSEGKGLTSVDYDLVPRTELSGIPHIYDFRCVASLSDLLGNPRKVESKLDLERRSEAWYFPSSGFSWLPIEHESDVGPGMRSSEEEAWGAAFWLLELWYTRQLRITQSQSRLTCRTLTAQDILVVAPYNAQVHTLRRVFDEMGERVARAAQGDITVVASPGRNPSVETMIQAWLRFVEYATLRCGWSPPFAFDDVRIGTVDKFQGQQAPVVIISTAIGAQRFMPRTSMKSEETVTSETSILMGSPLLKGSNSSLETTVATQLSQRELDFVLDPARLNVALSRSQCIALVVSSPSILTSAPYSVEQLIQQAFFASVCVGHRVRN